MKTAKASVEAYIKAQPESSQPVLQRVRDAIRQAIPSGVECISYSIPAYKLDGKIVVFFAGWKNHYSLYPVTAPVQAAFKDELSRYELSKGTVRFPLDEKVPVTLIKRIVKFRAGLPTRKPAASSTRRPPKKGGNQTS